jgi:hypothetical protein
MSAGIENVFKGLAVAHPRQNEAGSLAKKPCQGRIYLGTIGFVLAAS